MVFLIWIMYICVRVRVMEVRSLRRKVNVIKTGSFCVLLKGNCDYIFSGTKGWNTRRPRILGRGCKADAQVFSFHNKVRVTMMSTVPAKPVS